MWLIFRSRSGICSVEWAHYALLRDNVQHYLESAPGTEKFQALHAIERAVDGRARYVRAAQLRCEIQRAWSALNGLPLCESAVSLRTRALLNLQSSPPVARWTIKASLAGWPLPVDGDGAKPLRDYLQHFVEALLALTEGLSPLDDICVTRSLDHGAQT